MAVDKPIKVAVIGGGCASIAAAFELTQPEHKLPNGRPKYAVTVYQMGWRLGGKAASGRGPKGRIEEHGLHVWLGFYENAFRLMRACYQELTDDPQSWRKYFFPDSHIGVAGDSSKDGWEAWTAYFPPTEGLPGDPLDDQHNPFTLGSYLARAVVLLRTLLLSVHTDLGPRRKHGKGKRSSTDAALDAGRLEFSTASPRLLVDKMAQMLRVGVLSTAAGLLQAMLILEVALRHRVTLPGSDYTVLEFIEAVATNTRRQLEDVVAIDPHLRKRTEIIELVLAILVGVVRDKLLTNPIGLDAINGIDCRDWLLRHGATRGAVDSAFVRGLYNMAFADQAIAGKKRGLAAGQALRGALRMFFTYRGALFWRMRGSMGDVVFAPFYQVLKKRGVKFEFFHRLEKVKVVDRDKLAKDELLLRRGIAVRRAG